MVMLMVSEIEIKGLSGGQEREGIFCPQSDLQQRQCGQRRLFIDEVLEFQWNSFGVEAQVEARRELTYMDSEAVKKSRSRLDWKFPWKLRTHTWKLPVALLPRKLRRRCVHPPDPPWTSLWFYSLLSWRLAQSVFCTKPACNKLGKGPPHYLENSWKFPLDFYSTSKNPIRLSTSKTSFLAFKKNFLSTFIQLPER